jgi:cell division septum initiation protein DivIVA
MPDPYESNRFGYDEPAWGSPPPPAPGSVIIRDQTAARMGSAEELTREIDALDVRRGRVDSGEVRALVGRAAGTIEALEGEASRVPELLEEIEELKAQLAQATGVEDERALRLWRASVISQAQQAAEKVYGDARAHADALVADARRRADGVMEEAHRRAAAIESPDGLPARPKRMDDRIEDAVVRARYHDAIRSWLGDQDTALQRDLDAIGKDLDEARQLRVQPAAQATPRAAGLKANAKG